MRITKKEAIEIIRICDDHLKSCDQEYNTWDDEAEAIMKRLVKKLYKICPHNFDYRGVCVYCGIS